MRGVFHFAIGVVVALLGSVMCVGFGGCSERAKPATDAQPANVRAQRVVVLSPALAVIVRDLGYADLVVARHAYDDVLPSALPAVGDQAGIDYEALLRVEPTHVLVQWGARELPERLLQLAEQHDWRVINANPLSLDDIGRAVAEIDGALSRGTSEKAADLQRQIAELRADSGNEAWGPVLLLASIDPPAALGPGSCHDEVLRGVGGMPAIDKGTAWMELSHEDLVRLQPRAIVLIRPRGARGVTDADVEPTTQAWDSVRGLGLRAIESGHVAVIDDPEGLLPSTSMIRVGDTLRKVIASWRVEAE
jgi:ABC-type hemin transport system substrate-binding protein